MSLTPRQPVPPLTVDLIGGGSWSIEAQEPDLFTMVVFYRGLHCPICKPYLRDLDRKLSDFAELGIQAVAMSSDSQARAEQTKEDWGIERLPIGFGLAIDAARAWGLFVSSGIGKTSIGIEEPALFNEPGLFLVRPDGTLYASIVQTMPFARPVFDQVLQSMKVVKERNYPARGEA